MTIDKSLLIDMMTAAATLLKQASARLGEIDSRFGDGDHGVTIVKIARVIEQKTSEWQQASPQDSAAIHDFLAGLGEAVTEVGGGSAGPLYGTMIGALADPVGQAGTIDAPLLKAMLAASRDAMCEISQARIGDKTMMDALLPAVDAALGAPDDVTAVLEVAAAAASAGAKASEGFVARFGRARSYKEQTIGFPDAGAVSTSILFQGWAEAARARSR